MRELLYLSIALQTVAVVWSIVVWRSARNWRLGLLTAFLLLMLLRRVQSLAHELGWIESPVGMMTESIAVAVSSLGVVAVASLHLYLLGRGKSDRHVHLLASALSSSSDAVLITDANLDEPGPTIVFVNDSMCRLAGYERSELVGRSPRVLQGHRTDRAMLNRLKVELRAGRAFEGEAVNYARDGREYWVSWSIVPVRDDAGKVTHFLSTQRDVSDRKRIEADLDAGEERYRRLIEGVDVIAWEADANFRLTFVSGAAERLLGYPVSAWYKETFWVDHLHPEDRDEAVSYSKSKTAAGQGHDFTYRMIAADGRAVWVRDLVSVKMENGRVAGLRGVMIDVTERRAIEAELRSSEERYRALIEVTATGYAVIDDQGRVVEANAEYVRLTGRRSIDGVKGHAVMEWTAPHDLERNAEEVRKCVRVGYARDLEVDYITPDGTIVPIEVNAMRMQSDSGMRIISICRDISARKRAESELRESQSNFTEIARSIDQVFWLSQTRPSKVLYVSPAFERIWGIRAEDVYADSNLWVTAIHPEDRDRVQQAYDAWIDDPARKQYDVEYRLLKDSGEVRWIHARGGTASGLAEIPTRLAGIAADITEQRDAAMRIRDSEQRLASMVRHTPLAVIMWDPNFRVAEWNPAAEEIFGWTSAESIGQHARFIIPESAHAYVDQVWKALRSNRGGFRATNENVTKDGRVILCEWYNSSLLDDRGDVIGVVSVCEDVTERKRAEHRQHTLMLELDHRVKNNLAAILALAEQTLHASSSLQQFGEAFTGRLRAMSRMHELLARSRWQPVHLHDLVQRSLEAYLIGPEPPIVVQGEPLLLPSKLATGLSLVLHELATNASKHGSLSAPYGRVNVHWKTEPVGAQGQQRIVIDWKETGGPPVCPPTSRGFGTGLIEGIVAYEFSGTVTFTHDPAGLVCRMLIPLPPVTDEAETHDLDDSKPSSRIPGASRLPRSIEA